MNQIVGKQVSVKVPSGWEVEIDSGASGNVEANQHLGSPRIHIANFALPPNRGDFGSGAVERMGAGDVLLCLLEEDPTVIDQALYRNKGLPQFTANDFAPEAMQRPIRGQSGAQKFFQMNGRAFVAYVVMGSHLYRGGLIEPLNTVLGSLEF